MLARPAAQVIVITSDKCYANREQVWGYREIDAMGGHDPYTREQRSGRAGGGRLSAVLLSARQTFRP